MNKNPNAEKFVQFLMDNKITAEPLEINYTEAQEAFVWMNTTVDGTGYPYRILAIFSPTNHSVDIRGFNLVENIKDEHKLAVMELINTQNRDKRWGKFFMEENNSISQSTPLHSASGEFVPADVFQILVMIKESTDELHKKVLKAML